MDKDIQVQRVAVKIHAVERSIDDTLALAAELMIEMRAACGELNLAAQTSDGAFSKVIAAMTELQAARSSVVASHKRMDKIREAVGLRTVAGLSPHKIDDTEEEFRMEANVARLRG
jgi:phage-related tail protein